MNLDMGMDERLKMIYQEFNITEDSFKRDVNYLMEWMEKQAHLPNIKDEKFISNVLIQCKNSMEKAKKKLDSYYCTKAILPHIFTQRDPTSDEFKRIFNISALIPLPKLTPEGYRVFIYRIFEPENSHLVTVDEYMKTSFMQGDLFIKEDFSKKVILIYDLDNITMSMANTMFNAIRKYARHYQSVYTSRIHSTHVIVQMSPVVSTMHNIVKNLLSKKLFERLVLWTKEKPDFISMFPAEIIPEEYGGKEISIKKLREIYYEYICGFQEWFKLQDELLADLSKRTDDLYKISTDESLEGSFRQLQID